MANESRRKVTRAQLRGWPSLLLEQYGYPPENIQILSDAKGSSKLLPTRDNIVSTLHVPYLCYSSGRPNVYRLTG